MSRSAISAEGRFWAKVSRRGDDDCWPWTASLDPYGYGKFGLYRGRTVKAHRFAYELLIGPAPPTIDHTCHPDDGSCAGGPTCPHRRCCNPRHMAAATRGENALRGVGPQAVNARKTHCSQGHELAGENLYTWRGKRDCLKCRRDRAREYQRQRREASP